jgi:hypothetical protein
MLPSLLAEFAGKVNLIYIDPPFDTGADFSFTATVPDYPDDPESDVGYIQAARPMTASGAPIISRTMRGRMGCMGARCSGQRNKSERWRRPLRPASRRRGPRRPVQHSGWPAIGFYPRPQLVSRQRNPLHAGAWIETLAASNGNLIPPVAPRAGAWIETPPAQVMWQTAAIMTDAVTWTGTFHGIGASFLREYADQIGLDRAFTIHDREDSANDEPRSP